MSKKIGGSYFTSYNPNKQPENAKQRKQRNMSMKEKKLNDVTQFVEMVSKKQDWPLQTDANFLHTIKKGLLSNYQRHGYFLCPCRDGSGEKAKDQDIICPCIYNVPDQQEHGHCFCGLFFSKHAKQSHKTAPRQIPDRRPANLND